MFTGGLGAAGRGIGEASSHGLGATASSQAARHARSIVSDTLPTGRVRLRPTPMPETHRGARQVISARQPQAGRRASWLRRYQLGLAAIDATAASLAALVSFLLRFGTTSGGRYDAVVGLVLPLAWVALVGANRGYEGRFVGVGSAEFQRIFHAFLQLTALVAIASFVTRADLARGFVLVVLPSALVLDLIFRFTARKWLHRQRAHGRAMTSVLVVGDADAIADFTGMLRRDRYAGMRVVGACVPSELTVDPHTIDVLDDIDVPLLGDVDSVRSAVQLSRTDTVAVVSSGSIGPEKLRWISWQLEGSATDLVVSPGLTEVAGPRLHIQPVAGLPLLHVEEPEFAGFRRVLKSGFDRTVAVAALLILSPVLIALVFAIRLGSNGPALFRQTRVGRDGRTFTMLKFRSMYADAEDRLVGLSEQSQHGDGILFKMRNDPRITKVGRLLRKFSLDELPQLINVVTGSMSLVGPRPPLPREVARYEDHVHRRLLVKPGLTGLWQVSGRSDLAWDESVRLDLRYVENWSIAGDLQILWKTMFAVARGTGAY
jgi:exopolysaccharide biosynthesis polyprenyl glycosylphosphotransferase